ncbi:MAG: hypothetical protein QOH90_991 [Actinomycetota bacterium]|nr:hypothetical protein [Actinomycetota bacterium]
MTRQERLSFSRAWPDLSRRLRALLAARGVNATSRDDIVQETGLRLVRMWSKIDAESPLWPLAATIAMNLIRDEARKGRDRELIGDIPDVPAGLDVEEAALARLELQRIGRALTKLAPSHRDALLGEVMREEAPAIPSGGAAKMVRMRARRRLALVLDTLAAWAAGVSRWFKKESEWVQPVTASVLTAAAFVAGAGWPGSVAESHGPGYAAARPHVVVRLAKTSLKTDARHDPARSVGTTVPKSTETAASQASPTVQQPRQDGDHKTTIFEVDGVDDTPEKTSVQVLDTYIRVGDQSSDKPVCVDNSPVEAPGTDCSESPAP